MRGASQVLLHVPRKGRFRLEAPKTVKDRKDDASQLNRLIFYSITTLRRLPLPSAAAGTESVDLANAEGELLRALRRQSAAMP
jgi:hypothetical protein